MRELNGELSWDDISYEDDFDLIGEDLDDFEDSHVCDDSFHEEGENPEEENQVELEYIFSARKATQILLKKYPDAFKYDPKSMTLDKFIKPTKGLTEFGWLYLQMLAYSVSGKYYRYEDQNSLNTLAVSDCAWWLDNKVRYYDGKISNLRAILYTRIRNTMSNTLYKDNKYIATEDTVLDRNAVPDTHVHNEGIEDSDFVLDYVYRDLKEARLLTMRMWDLNRGITRKRGRPSLVNYRYKSPKET